MEDGYSCKRHSEYYSIVFITWQNKVVHSIMSMKIRISYEKPQELQKVTELLKPIIKSCKADKGENGRYKRAYLEVNIPEENARKSVNAPLI